MLPLVMTMFPAEFEEFVMTRSEATAVSPTVTGVALVGMSAVALIAAAASTTPGAARSRVPTMTVAINAAWIRWVSLVVDIVRYSSREFPAWQVPPVGVELVRI